MVDIRPVYDHYEIWIDGRFHCSCDNLEEVNEEVQLIENEQ